MNGLDIRQLLERCYLIGCNAQRNAIVDALIAIKDLRIEGLQGSQQALLSCFYGG